METAEKLPWLWGPHSALGAIVALATFAADQAHKWWMILGYDIEAKGRVAINRYFDLVYKKNTGISYSMLDMASYKWQLALAAFSVVASLVLWVWIARTPGVDPAGLGLPDSRGLKWPFALRGKLMAVSLALIIGGALGNGLDRVLHAGVIDYISVHFPWGTSEFYWYIFNIADCAIVAGVAGLLYESTIASRNDAAKPG